MAVICSIFYKNDRIKDSLNISSLKSHSTFYTGLRTFTPPDTITATSKYKTFCLARIRATSCAILGQVQSRSTTSRRSAKMTMALLSRILKG